MDNVPGVGPVPRVQLRLLQQQLLGNVGNSGSDFEALPNLIGLNPRQMRQLCDHVASLPPLSANPLEVRQRPAAAGVEAQAGAPVLHGNGTSLVASSPVAPAAATERGAAHACGSSGALWEIDEDAFRRLLEPTSVPRQSHECSICFSDLSSGSDAVVLPCGRKQGCNSVFHADCIRPWLERNPSCPLCRSSMQELVNPVPQPLLNSSSFEPLFVAWMAAVAANFDALQTAATAASILPPHDLLEARRAFRFLERRRRAAPPGPLDNLRGVAMPASMMIEFLQNSGVVEAPRAGASVGRSAGASLDATGARRHVPGPAGPRHVRPAGHVQQVPSLEPPEPTSWRTMMQEDALVRATASHRS